MLVVQMVAASGEGRSKDAVLDKLSVKIVKDSFGKPLKKVKESVSPRLLERIAEQLPSLTISSMTYWETHLRPVP